MPEATRMVPWLSNGMAMVTLVAVVAELDRTSVAPARLWNAGGVPPTQLEMLCPSAPRMNSPALSRTAPPPTQKLPAVQSIVPWFSSVWLDCSRTALVTSMVAPDAMVVVPAPDSTPPDHSAVPVITKSPVMVPPLNRNRPAPCSLAGATNVVVPALISTVAPLATSMTPLLPAADVPPLRVSVPVLPLIVPSLSTGMAMVATPPEPPLRARVAPAALWNRGTLPPTQLDIPWPSTTTLKRAAFSITAPPPKQKLPAFQLTVPWFSRVWPPTSWTEPLTGRVTPAGTVVVPAPVNTPPDHWGDP
jgi:hypothetical protein